MTEPVDVPLTAVRDPKELRALAHPVRIRLLEELAFGGPQTATELADRVDESPANCSWHLRQLERYGFVEEAGGGRGRQRPWRIVIRRNSWEEVDPDPELALAGQALSDVLLAHEFTELRTARMAFATEPAAWRDASFVNQTITWLTVEELTELQELISATFNRSMARISDPAARPEGARPIRLLAWGVPARPLTGRNDAPGGTNDDDPTEVHDA